MATKEISIARCKGPGGYVEVIADIDEITGAVIQYRIKADAGAKLNVRLAGVKITKSTVLETPGKFYDEVDHKSAKPTKSLPWPPMELSS